MKSDKASPRLVDINEFRGYGKALLERWVMDHPVNEIHLPLKEYAAHVVVTEDEIVIRMTAK